MESKERTSKKKLILRKEKLIRKIDYDSLTKASNGEQKSRLYLGNIFYDLKYFGLNKKYINQQIQVLKYFKTILLVKDLPKEY